MAENDFLQPLLDLMNKRMDGFDSKIDANTAKTQQVLDEVSGIKTEVDTHDKAIKRLETARGSKPFTLSPNIVSMLAMGFVLLLAIIAVLLHINIGSLL